jgi:hypothetical protein
VGGVSERAGAKAGGSHPSAYDSFACRDGESHPGLLEGGALRGASSERGPRSVRRLWRLSCRGGRRAYESGSPMGAVEGNVVGIRHQAYAPDAGTRNRFACAQGTRPSLGPSTRARRSSLCSEPKRPGGGASQAVSRSGKPVKAGGTGTGVVETDVARLAACHRFRKGEGVARQRRKEVEASVPARIESPGLVARTSKAVAEVGRRRLVSNKLGKRAPKRAVRVE